MRQDRLTLERSSSVWAHEDLFEYEIPYTEEAWAGVEKIAAALMETQKKLDDFTARATGESLTQLGTTGLGMLLLPSSKDRKRVGE